MPKTETTDTDNTRRCKRIGDDGNQCSNRAPWQTRDCGEHAAPVTRKVKRPATRRTTIRQTGSLRPHRRNDDPNNNRRAARRDNDDAAQVGRGN